MNNSCTFNNSTNSYLRSYCCILDNMIRQMNKAEMNDSISRNFILQMIPHHQAAIDMSASLLQYTSCEALQLIARNIIDEQTKSIADMRSIVCSCAKVTNSMDDLCMYQRRTEQIMHNMFSKMRCARTTNSIDCDFMWEMIPHHQGAVEMASNTIQFDICPELIPILTAIITSQKKGIAQMRQLQNCMHC